jgi:hypothetical protein
MDGNNENNNQQTQQQTYNQQYQQPYNQQSYNQQSSYNQQYQTNYNGQQLEPPLTLGNWIIIMILVAIPCVNIVMLLIWSFGKNVNTSKKNYSRAMLIFMLIGIVLSLIFSSVLAAMFSSLGGFGGNYY